MKTGEVVRRSGLSRQWLSRMAALGEIPGAKRTRSGRWEFTSSQQLDEWMARTGRRTRIRRRRRLLHQDEAEVQRLQRKAAKLWSSPRSKDARRRLEELTGEIAAKRAAVRDYMTARQLAVATGRSRRWVTGRARSIPGALMAQNKFVFSKSQSLSDWIHREQRLCELERRLLPGDIRFPRSRMAVILLTTFRYERAVLREINQLPFSDWPKAEQREFAKTFGHMVHEIRHAAGVHL